MQSEREALGIALNLDLKSHAPNKLFNLHEVIGDAFDAWRQISQVL